MKNILLKIISAVRIFIAIMALCIGTGLGFALIFFVIVYLPFKLSLLIAKFAPLIFQEESVVWADATPFVIFILGMCYLPILKKLFDKFEHHLNEGFESVKFISNKIAGRDLNRRF